MTEKIELQVGGALVEGRVEGRREGAVCVELTRPHGPLRLSVPASRMAVGADADLADHGREMLDLLYRIASYVHDNRAMLVEILARIFSNLGMLSAEAIDRTKLVEYRRRLEHQLAKGEIDDEQYRMRLQTVEDSHRDFQRRLHGEMDRFFREAFPMDVPEECWEQVLGIIGRQRAPT